MATLHFDLTKVRRNLDTALDFCRARGLTLLPVTKLFQSRPDLLKAIDHPALHQVADVNSANLVRLDPRRQTGRVLLRPRRQDAAATAAGATRVFLSDPDLALRLSQARQSQKAKTPLHVTLMIEAGDLRDGVPLEQVPEVADQIARLPGLELTGLGLNLGCLHGALPSPGGLDRVAQTLRRAREKTGLPLPELSLGGTVTWDFLKQQNLPPEFTELRLGEAFLFGWNTSLRSPVPEMEAGVFRLDLEVLEVWTKVVHGLPDRRAGRRVDQLPAPEPDDDQPTGFNAFGEPAREPFTGPRRRAVLEGGENIAPYRSLTPLQPGIHLVGETHEYLVADCQEASPAVQPGMILNFQPAYEAVARCFLSPYLDLQTGDIA